MDSGLTSGNEDTEDADRKTLEGFRQLAVECLNFIRANPRPGYFVVEVHHDSDGIKLLKPEHRDKLKTITLS